MTREDPKRPRRHLRGALVLWIALATLAATLAIGVTVTLRQHPTLSSDLWPVQTPVPRPAP